MVHPAFGQLFIKKELRSLLGSKFKNLLWLSFIFFITFLAIGFSNGSLDYLSIKMKSPFVNWVNIAIPYAHADKMDQIIGELNQEDIKKRFHIHSVKPYHEFTMNFWDVKSNGTRVAIGRSFNIDDPAGIEVFNSKNLIIGRPFEHPEEVGLIITEKFFKESGYDTTQHFIYWRFKDTENSYRNIPLPIVAIVKELPGRHLFATTPYMYALLYQSPTGSAFNPIEEKELYLYVAATESKANEIRNDVSSFFNDRISQNFKPFVVPTLIEHKESFSTGYIIKVIFRSKIESINQIDSLYKVLLTSDNFSRNNTIILRHYNYATRLFPISSIGQYDNLSVNFEDLSKVREFAKFLSTLEYSLKIDMAQTEAKENYDFVSKLTRISSLILLFFSIYTISIFLSNTLRMHIERISMNLGTLMAFGIDNSDLKHIYLNISLRFVGISMLTGLITAFIFGHLGGVKLILIILQSGLETNNSYFSLNNFWTFFTLFSTLLSSIFTVIFTLKKMLSHSPGDLVYQRI